MIRRLPAVLAVVLTATAALAQTFYVATNGVDQPGGGTSGNPWATISYAVQQVPDGALILARAGTYTGRVRLDREFSAGITVRSEVPYQARLRSNGETTVTCYYGTNITLEGFDVAHDPANTAALVVQIQDLLGSVPGIGSGSDPCVRGIVLRDNVFHDSTNNDVVKINNGCREVTVEGNMFYNQRGSDEHIDVNSVVDVVVQDNVFLSQIPGNANDTSSFIVIKDSNQGSDGVVGAARITVRRNVFLNWEGSDGSNFLLVGEDGNPYHEGYDIVAENNLMLGNAANMMRSAFGVKGGRDITFRNNTVVGDLPSRAFAMRLIAEGSNPANDNVRFYNNVWSDPAGTMGAEGFSGVDFAEVPATGNNATHVLGNNLYWNGGQAIPPDATQILHYTDDPARIVADPRLPSQAGLVVPVYNGTTFADGSTRIRGVFQRLVTLYGTPAAGSPVRDAADPANAAADDILGNPRGVNPDVGCQEAQASGPDAQFSGAPLSGPAPLAVTFTDLSTGAITSWSWTFGDGGTSAAPSPSHSYLASGSYTVALTVSDGTASDTETKPAYVIVTGSNPIDNFLTGRGRAAANPNDVRIHSLGGIQQAAFTAYGAGQWGTLVGSGDVDGSGLANPVTGPGPGAVYGPQVRAFQADGTAIAKVSFYAYGTLRYGVNVSAGLLDADGPDEMLSGAGPGAVFGPHVRGFNYDGVALAAMAKVSFFAYGTLKYGVNVGRGDLEQDGFHEILTGPGPGAVFGPQVRGFDYDGVAVSAMAKVNFNAFGTGTYGASVAGGSVDADGYDEIAAGRGMGAGLGAQIRGFDYDGAAITPLPGFDTSLGTGYGAHPALGDVDGDAVGELVAGPGEDPAAPAQVSSFDYTGAALTPITAGTFTAFAGGTYGAIPATGVFGY